MARPNENSHPEDSNIPIERVQIGVRMEKRMLKVLKALAEYYDVSLGDLLEGMTLHAFENKTPFSQDTLQRIVQLKEVYGMDYGVSASHRFTEHSSSTDERKTNSKESNR